MKRKQLKKFKKRGKVTPVVPAYIKQLKDYETEYQDYPAVTYLIKQILLADQFLAKQQLPQNLPDLELPDDIQDQIYRKINEKYDMGDPKGDELWEKLSSDLPELDRKLRSFRDYLEEQYGMWAYISSGFTAELAKFLNGRPALEVMAGNGYISQGLQNNHAQIIATDSLTWTHENQTGKQTVVPVEQLTALEAYEKYKDQVDFIIMCWSPDGLPIDMELLNSIRNDDYPVQLLVIGEQNGATNSPEFWQTAKFVTTDDLTELNQFYPHFDLIKDQVYLVK
ncbi:SAM-dependent methyltransferase [Fructilactobacillus vespulae]|uniref:SAM-dependent methyltransferase n=1 Tax=Fructilactobacillus vespulae TaxID=1249630 RepID=UPI0039B4D562